MPGFVTFVENEFPTVGIEQEFHLIDPRSGELAPRVDDVWARVDGESRGRVSYELLLCILETQSPVCRTIDELVDEAVRGRQELSTACAEVGVMLVAGGTHPFGAWRRQPFVQTDHYAWVRKHHGYLAHRLLSFGLHVHVGMRSADGGIYVMNELRRWAWPLLALSANSPYYEGQRTTLASTRMHVMGSMPRTELAPNFRTFAELEAFYDKLVAAGDLEHPGCLWWAIRVQPPLGTVELRLFDMPTDVRRLGALSAITQAAAAWYQDRYEQGVPATELDLGYLNQNRWKAMRYGLDGDMVDPATGEVLSTRDQLGRLLDLIGPKAEELRAVKHLAFGRSMLESGTESDWQIAFCDRNGHDLRALELEIARRTVPSLRT